MLSWRRAGIIMAEMNGNLTSCARPPLQLLERGGLARHLAGGLVASFRRQAGFKRQGFASGLALCRVVLACYVQAQTAQETLVTVAAVRDRTVAHAQRQPPVRVRGVVTFFDEALFSRFFQDGTAGI